jgi:hypothetical protein
MDLADVSVGTKALDSECGIRFQGREALHAEGERVLEALAGEIGLDRIAGGGLQELGEELIDGILRVLQVRIGGGLCLTGDVALAGERGDAALAGIDLDFVHVVDVLMVISAFWARRRVTKP